MAIQIFQTLAGAYNGFQKQSGTYPPTGSVFIGSSGAGRTFGAGLYTVTVLAFRAFITLPTDARVIAARLLLNVTAKNDQNARSLNGEWYPYDGGQWAGHYTEESPATAFTKLLSTIFIGADQAIDLSALNNIPFNGYAALRLSVSGLVPAGKNDLGFNPGSLPKFEVTYTRTQQPQVIEPVSGGYDVTQPITFRWRHINNTPLAQSRYRFEHSINAGAWVLFADVVSPNEFHVVAGNTYPVGSTVRWRVSTAAQDESDLFSPVSQEYQIFMGAAVAIPNVTAPNGQINVANPQVTWTSTQGDRIAWQVRIIRPADGAVIIDSGRQAGQALAWNPVYPDNTPLVLADLTNYRADVRVWSGQDVAGAYGTRAFNTVFNPPPLPTVVAANQAANFRNVLTITNPASGGGQDIALYNRIYRSQDGGVTYDLIKEIWPLNTPYNDYMAISGVTHHYKVEAVGTTGSVRMSAASAALLTIKKGFTIHDIYDPAATILNIEGWRGDMKGAWSFDVAYAEYETPTGTRRVALESDGFELDNFDANFVILTKVTSFYPVNKWPLYEALIRRRSIYCIRTFGANGKRYVGKISSLPHSIVDSNGMLHGFSVSLHLEAVSINEAEI
jgi:hypothetical protein